MLWNSTMQQSTALLRRGTAQCFRWRGYSTAPHAAEAGNLDRTQGTVSVASGLLQSSTSSFVACGPIPEFVASAALTQLILPADDPVGSTSERFSNPLTTHYQELVKSGVLKPDMQQVLALCILSAHLMLDAGRCAVTCICSSNSTRWIWKS